MLFNRHYQYRDPIQIQRRLELRHGDRHFPHESSPDWHSVIRASADLHLAVDGQPWHHSPLRYYRTRLPALLRDRSGVAARLIATGGP
jgi:hypothetical protein